MPDPTAAELTKLQRIVLWLLVYAWPLPVRTTGASRDLCRDEPFQLPSVAVERALTALGSRGLVQFDGLDLPCSVGNGTWYAEFCYATHAGVDVCRDPKVVAAVQRWRKNGRY